jgi:hypothetical protein
VSSGYRKLCAKQGSFGGAGGMQAAIARLAVMPVRFCKPV